MRRIPRKIAANETDPDQLGDISTLANSDIVKQIIDKHANRIEVGEIDYYDAAASSTSSSKLGKRDDDSLPSPPPPKKKGPRNR